MPHSIQWEPHGVRVDFTGTVGAQEIVRIYEAISSDARSDGLRYVLTDYLGACRSTDMTLTDVKGFVALEQGASYAATDAVWRAAVATDASICDFLRYFKSVRTSTEPFEIFSCEEAAREWLAGHPRLRSRPGSVEPPAGRRTAGG